MSDITVPAALAEVFKEVKEVKAAFLRMPPSHQKEYINYIREAKKPETKYKRVRHVIEMILHEAERHPFGYSGTPLVKKLGIHEGVSLRVVNEPDNYFDLIGHPKIDLVKDALSTVDIAHLFVTSIQELEEEFPKLQEQVAKDGALWVSWPKGGKAGINENKIRDFALDHGMVDVKVCAVDGTWSGLKLVFRKEDRG